MSSLYQGRILNIAHRGARRQAPENTLPAFIRAADLGADGIEFDIQLTADDQIVCIHDSTVDRTTDGTGKVVQLTLSELRKLDAGSTFDAEFAGTQIPTLEEVITEVSGRLLLNIELKSYRPGYPQANQMLISKLVSLINKHNIADHVICSSFYPPLLHRLYRKAPDINLGLLVLPQTPRFLMKAKYTQQFIAGKHAAKHPHYASIDRDYLLWARKHGFRVNVWTVNELEDIKHMRDLGVDMIISDLPDLVQDVLQGEL